MVGSKVLPWGWGRLSQVRLGVDRPGTPLEYLTCSHPAVGPLAAWKTAPPLPWGAEKTHYWCGDRESRLGTCVALHEPQLGCPWRVRARPGR